MSSLPIKTRTVDPDMEKTVSAVQKILDYEFRDPYLLQEALTHSSYPHRQSFQRLEFVGDAALTLAFSNFLYLTNADVNSGCLSALRAANISTEKFARVAISLGLYQHLQRNCPNLDKLVDEFTEQVKMEEEQAPGEVPYGGTEMKAPKVLADIVEAIAAAIYIDCRFDLEFLWKVFRKHLHPIITVNTMDQQPMTTLCELCQKHSVKLDFVYKKEGTMTVTKVVVNGDVVGSGSSEQKAISKLNAVRDALQHLPHLLPETPIRMPRDKEGAKQKLNDLCTKNHWNTALYRVELEEGPDHNKRYISSVEVATNTNIFVTLGDEKAKVKDAENSAAAKMLSGLLSENEN